MFFVIDENNNKIEAYDKEGVLAVLSKAIADGSLSGISANAGFVSRLKCCVGGDTHPIAFVTQAKYNELEARGSLIKDCIYYITDDTTAETTDQLLRELTDFVNGFKEGSISAKSLKLNSNEDFKFSTSLAGTLPVGKGVIPYNILYFAMFVDDTGCAYTGMFTNIDVEDGMACFGSLGGAKLEYIQDLGSMYITNEDGGNLSGYLVLRKVADMG